MVVLPTVELHITPSFSGRYFLDEMLDGSWVTDAVTTERRKLPDGNWELLDEEDADGSIASFVLDQDGAIMVLDDFFSRTLLKDMNGDFYISVETGLINSGTRRSTNPEL